MVGLLDQARKRAEREFPASRRFDRFIKRLAELRSRYEQLGDTTESEEVYASLEQRTRRILSATRFGEVELDAVLRHAAAAWYDLAGRRTPFRMYAVSFFVATIGFFLLAPQFFPPLFALLFVVPVFIGLKGLKARTLNGFTLTAMVYPVSLLAATTAARSYFSAIFGDLAAFVSRMAQSYHIPTGTAEVFVFVFASLSVVTGIAAIAGAIVGFLHRDMFV
ncbi:MAG: hypothetical protein N3A02_01980 [Rectinema sp.]|nr:hypothetical protein [Rectinema sp.]